MCLRMGLDKWVLKLDPKVLFETEFETYEASIGEFDELLSFLALSFILIFLQQQKNNLFSYCF